MSYASWFDTSHIADEFNMDTNEGMYPYASYYSDVYPGSEVASGDLSWPFYSPRCPDDGRVEWEEGEMPSDMFGAMNWRTRYSSQDREPRESPASATGILETTSGYPVKQVQTGYVGSTQSLVESHQSSFYDGFAEKIASSSNARVEALGPPGKSQSNKPPKRKPPRRTHMKSRTACAKCEAHGRRCNMERPCESCIQVKADCYDVVYSTAKRLRRQKKTACDRCATLKKKCDGKTPCGCCSGANIACTWNQRDAGAEAGEDESVATN
jgi:hypothetical protein